MSAFFDRSGVSQKSSDIVQAMCLQFMMLHFLLQMFFSVFSKLRTSLPSEICHHKTLESLSLRRSKNVDLSFAFTKKLNY